MTRADNSHHLQRAAVARHESAMARARNAIEQLDRACIPVTFAAVAAAAGVSRSWLYTEADLRDAITGLRRTRSATSTAAPAAQRATTDSLLERLDSARDEITRLRAENTTLHARVARSLGEQRTHR